MRLYAATLLFALTQVPASPVIDGRIGDEEWAGAERHALEGGGDLQLLRRGEDLFVAVRGAGPGLASLCVAAGTTVRILHASAAVGEGAYVQQGTTDTWTKRADFDWAFRDSPRGAAPAEDAKTAFFAKSGWLANASAAGSPDREFRIRAAGVESLAVTYLTVQGLSLAHWPPSVADDCKAVRIAQGFLPDTARFAPSGWHVIR